MKMNAVAALICAVWVLGGGGVGAVPELASPPQQEKPAAKVERKGVMAGLPSAPGPTIAKIKALKDGEWLNLGPPAPDPNFGAARGRTWSCKMPYAADAGGAFISGEGVHAFVDPKTGRLMDDIYFYDLYAHRWICIYPGMDTRNFVENIKKGELKLNDDGQLVDKGGQPVPFSATGIHSYQNHTYDSDLHKYVFGSCGKGFGENYFASGQEWIKTGKGLLSAQGKADRMSGACYAFNTVTGKFERRSGGEPKPAPYVYVNALFYLPSRKGYFYAGAANSTFQLQLFYDPSTAKWSPLGAKGPHPPGLCDIGACYDSKRDRLYFGRGNYSEPQKEGEGNVTIYDAKTNAWSNPANKPNAGAFPTTNGGSVHYDSVSDRVLSLSYWKGKGVIGVYNPETVAWESTSEIPGSVLGGGREFAWHSFYSPEVNAHFVYLAGDSDPAGTMLVYRHKNAKQ